MLVIKMKKVKKIDLKKLKVKCEIIKESECEYMVVMMSIDFVTSQNKVEES